MSLCGTTGSQWPQSFLDHLGFGAQSRITSCLYIALAFFLKKYCCKTKTCIYSWKKVLPVKLSLRRLIHNTDLQMLRVWHDHACACERLQTSMSRARLWFQAALRRARSCLLWSQRNAPELPRRHKVKDMINKVFMSRGKSVFSCAVGISGVYNYAEFIGIPIGLFNLF